MFFHISRKGGFVKQQANGAVIYGDSFQTEKIRSDRIEESAVNVGD